ncbi:MAG: hypothetical protein U9P79_00870 [Candidatus Cloacimonadota bacterium]|nr:hypothetical protein [Candidatus Cloacimonadota bacterium]
MKKLFLILILLGLFSFSYAQQGKYVRKSVSSVETVLIKPGALEGINNFDYDFFDKLIDFYIETDRFDYNVLPEPIIQNFKTEMDSKKKWTTEEVSKVLKKTVVKKILEILNSNDVKQARGIALKDEAAFQSFAATKAKSLGLTAKELETLMNSAYIYLTYITSMKQSVSDGKISVSIKGGIIWYHVKIAPDFSVSVNQVVAQKSSARSFISHAVTDKNGAVLYYKFTFGKEVYKTTEALCAQYNAMLAWAKNLGVKTKKIAAFKLSGQIVEAKGRVYSVPIGFKEGVHLDNGYDIVEFVEDKNGNEKKKIVGYGRVIHTGNNLKNPNDYTKIRQYIGKKQSPGVLLFERPRLGISISLNPYYMLEMEVPKNATKSEYFSEISILGEDATTSVGADLIFSYNLAPIIGVTQTFFDLDVAYGVPLVKYNTDVSGYSSTLSLYGGFSKKMWFTRSNLNLNFAGGIDMLHIAGEMYSDDYTYSVGAWGAKANANLEYLLTPDWRFGVGAGYKYGLEPTSVKFNDNEEKISGVYEDINLGGISLNLTLSYDLSSLPINLFGWLDPLKKY